MSQHIQPSYTDFRGHHQAGKTQLVWRWMRADLETPVSAYLKLCGDTPPSFLLESVEGGAVLGRYSIIGFDPDLTWRYQDGKAETSENGESWKTVEEAPLHSVKNLIKASRIDVPPEDLPPMAVSGLFGYMAYDMIRLAEDIPDDNPDDIGLPGSILIRPQVLAIFDNIKNKLCLVTPVYAHAGNSDEDAEKIYERACKKLDTAAEKLGRPVPEKLLNTPSALSLPLDVQSNTTEAEYHNAVARAVDYIHQGEIFQAVLGQRFSFDFDLPAIDLYRAVRALNPSPFMVHMDMGGFSLVASSPEILVRVRGGIVTIRPIAGTRKRGTNATEDKALAEDLLADEKERAEHLMLLDLARNDVGRVSEFGSVKVTEEFNVELYSHVMHIVSNVEGALKSDLDIIDAHFAGFPAGTVSGAPKIRAMEIIDELEKNRRSYYGGSMGYFSGNNEMDTCIALRTALVKDGRVYVQAGAGIVADSRPDKEYEETVNKARALIEAAETAIEAAPEKTR